LKFYLSIYHLKNELSIKKIDVIKKEKKSYIIFVILFVTEKKKIVILLMLLKRIKMVCWICNSQKIQSMYFLSKSDFIRKYCSLFANVIA